MAAPVSGGGFFSKVSIFSGRAGLAAFVILALATVACAFAGRQAIAQTANYAIAASAAAAFLVAFWQLRHPGLALLVASAPVAAFVWCAAFAPSALGAILFPCIAFCTALASLFCHSVAKAIARGDEKAPAVSSAAAAMAWPFAGAVAAAILSGVGIALARSGFGVAWHPLAGFLCGSIAVFGLVVFGAGVLPYREDFIARWNRAAERRDRVADFLTARVQPRWAWSIVGIAIILATLAIFAARDAGALPGFLPVLGVAAVIFAIGFALTRDIRMAAALLLAFGFAGAVALWGYAKVGHGGLFLLQMLIVPLLLALTVGAAARKQTGEDARASYLRSFENNAMKICFAGLCAFASATPLVFSGGAEGIAVLFIVVVGAAGAVLFLPAFGLAIEAIAPRRRSLSKLYRAP